VDQSTIQSLALIAVAAVLAPLLAELLRKLRIPSVVIEIALGILIGQQVLGWAQVSDLVNGLSELGLAFLMFLAGFEIDLQRIKGSPLVRACLGWLLSLAIAFSIAVFLVSSGFALNSLVIGLALTTTALGTLLPMLRDADILTTRFGAFMLAIGTVGEFGPIVAIALLLSTDSPIGTGALLIVFVAVAVAAALLAIRPQPPKVVALLRKNLHSSSQLPVRISVLLIILLVWLASSLGLDVLLGAFAAGVVVRLLSHGEDGEVVRVKLEAIGFGFLVPIFFIVSGMQFDLDALLDTPSTVLRLPLFLLLFLIVRGIPALVLYRRDLPHDQLVPLALFSATGLPLIVVITGIGVDTGRMLPGNAAALVGAGMLSVLLFPLLGFSRLRRAQVIPDDSTLYLSDDIDAPDPPDE
jgi:Kef-type K+ transport system membrane component KefB